jgi:hypothetical protein
MMRKALIATALTLLIGAPAFADTPIGKGVTGAGGTGPNMADVDAKKREEKAPQPQVLNPDGSEPSRAAVPKDQKDTARGATRGTPGTGATGAPAPSAGVPATSGNIGGGEASVVKPDPTMK